MKRSTLWRTTGLAFLLMLGLGAIPAAQPGKPASLETVNQFNAQFREVYARERQAQLEQLEPLITVEGDELVLRRQGKKERVRTTPDSYHILKAVAHVPLSIYLILRRHPGGVVSADRLAELRRCRELLDRAPNFLPWDEISTPQGFRQKQLLKEARSFLERILERKTASRTEAVEFARSQRQAIVANVTEAAHAQLESIHAQVQKWRQQLPPGEWQKLRVIVQGPALPRRGNLAVQYFCHVLGEKDEGRRVLYAESIFETPRALELLATSELDSQIGTAFFNDERRMHRDLLADAATEYLKTLK